jgi:predicted PurR-regulated permease PerM
MRWKARCAPWAADPQPWAGTLGLFLQLGVALYQAFFLLRDGRAIAERVERAIPLPRPSARC